LGSPPTFVPNPSEAAWELASTDTYPSRNGPRARPRAGHDLRRRSRSADCLERCPRPGARAQHETYDNGVRKITFRDPEGAERTQLQRSSSLAAHKAAQEATTETARDAARAAGHAADAAYLLPLAKANQSNTSWASQHTQHAQRNWQPAGIEVWVQRDSSRLASERRFARRPTAIHCHS
jgi:hypothetical protein